MRNLIPQKLYSCLRSKGWNELFTNNLSKAYRAIARLQTTRVMIDKARAFRTKHFPFEGIKQSSPGRESIRFVESIKQVKTAVL